MKHNIFIEIENLINNNSLRTDKIGDYEAYSNDAEFDKALTDYIEVFNHLNENWNVILFSSRRERERYKIEKWLDKNEVSYEELILKPDVGFSNDWKEEFIVDYYGGHLSNMTKKTQLVITSDEKLVEAMREFGVKTLGNLK